MNRIERGSVLFRCGFLSTRRDVRLVAVNRSDLFWFKCHSLRRLYFAFTDFKSSLIWRVKFSQNCNASYRKNYFEIDFGKRFVSIFVRLIIKCKHILPLHFILKFCNLRGCLNRLSFLCWIVQGSETWAIIFSHVIRHGGDWTERLDSRFLQGDRFSYPAAWSVG